MKTLRTGLVLSVICASLASTSLQAGQPHMQQAITHLRAARAELQQAEANKGGHRERAIEAVNRAIQQCEEGIKFAR